MLVIPRGFQRTSTYINVPYMQNRRSSTDLPLGIKPGNGDSGRVTVLVSILVPFIEWWMLVLTMVFMVKHSIIVLTSTNHLLFMFYIDGWIWTVLTNGKSVGECHGHRDDYYAMLIIRGLPNSLVVRCFEWLCSWYILLEHFFDTGAWLCSNNVDPQLNELRCERIYVSLVAGIYSFLVNDFPSNEDANTKHRLWTNDIHLQDMMWLCLKT